MSAIVDRIDNGDNYNEDDARRYFNELIDIVYIHAPKYHDDDDDDDDEDDHNQDANDQDANDRLLMGRLERVAENTGSVLLPFNRTIGFIGVNDYLSLQILYLICYFKGNTEPFNYEFSEYNFIRRYVNFIENEYAQDISLPIESELLTGSAFRGGRQHDRFVDNFKNLFNALFGRDPEYDLTQYFTDVTRREVTIPNSWKTTLKTA
jgi:predicted ATPase